MEQATVDIREHFGMPEGINDERVVVVPSQGGPRLVKSRLTRVARETKAVKDAYNNEVKKVKDRFKEDKNQVIKFVKQPDAFQKRVLIPEDLLEVARAVFEPSKPQSKPTFPNAKRFQEYQKYPYNNL